MQHAEQRNTQQSLTTEQFLPSTPVNEDSASLRQAHNCDKTRHSQIWKARIALNHQLAHFITKIRAREVITTDHVPHSSKPDQVTTVNS